MEQMEIPQWEYTSSAPTKCPGDFRPRQDSDSPPMAASGGSEAGKLGFAERGNQCCKRPECLPHNAARRCWSSGGYGGSAFNGGEKNLRRDASSCFSAQQKGRRMPANVSGGYR